MSNAILWFYRIWFDKDTYEISTFEEEGTIIKIQEKNSTNFIDNPEFFKNLKEIDTYYVQLSKPLEEMVLVTGKFINTDKPIFEHTEGDDYNIYSDGTDYYYMGFTYYSDEPKSTIITRKRKCMSLCNKNILKFLEKKKTEIEKTISQLT